MKIIHTSDWHLGNNFHGYDRSEEHRHFLDWLLGVLRERMPDALIVAGDVFDTANPSAAAEQMFYDFLIAATEAVRGLQIVVIAGNHDAAGRIEAPARVLKRHNVYMRGIARHIDEAGDTRFEHLVLPLGNRLTNEAEVVCIALPYLRPSDYPHGKTIAEGLSYYFEQALRVVRKSDFKHLPVIATAHFYAAGSEICANEHSERLVVGGQDCVEADVVGKDICYTALGHIHKAQEVKEGKSSVHYAGSALPMSFSERGYRHGVNWVTIDSEARVKMERIAYQPLRRLKSIPEQGAASAAEVLRAIATLPAREKGDDGLHWPYLEIRVEERQPEPTLIKDVTTALESRAVCFCRMVRERPSGHYKNGAPRSIACLQSASPIEMAQRIYENRYHEAMPEALLTRLKQAEEMANKEEELEE